MKVFCCVFADHAESLIDYEDKFTDSYGDEEHHNDGAEVYQKVHVVEKKKDQKSQETNYGVEATRKVAGGQANEEPLEDRAVEDFTGHPVWEEEQETQVKADVTSTTDAPVSVLSQKHLFWFPSETFQEQVRPASTEVISQTTQRTSGVQSEESREQESQEVYHHPVDADELEQQGYDDHDTEEHIDDEDRHDRDDNHHDDQDDPDSHQEEDVHQHQVKDYIPAHDHDDRGDHDDHYDMGEHEGERGRTQYDSREFDGNDAYDEHESYEAREDVVDDHDYEHPDESQENPDKDDHGDHGDSKEHFDHDDHNDGREHDDDNDHDDDQKPYNVDEDDDDNQTHDDDDDDNVSHEQFDEDDQDNSQEHYGDDHDDTEDVQEHHDHDRVDDDDDGLNDQDDLEETDHDDHDSREHRDSEEDLNGQQHHVIFSNARDRGQNRTEEAMATTDETWLDGYPVNNAEESTTGKAGLENGDTKIATSPPVSSESPAINQWEDSWPSHVTIDDSSLEHTEDLPTPSWLPEVTEDTFTDHSPSPPVRNQDSAEKEHTVHGLPGESGQREGEIGEVPCTGQNCPPVTPVAKGPKVAAIIVVVCLVAIAALLGLWCYRRQQQKSSVYEMNSKGQSPMRPNQQMEMQQKV